MWYLILGSLGLFFIVSVIYCTICIHRFSFMKHFAEGHKVLAWILSFLPVALVGLFALINVFAMMIVFLHLLAGFAVVNAVGFIFRKMSRKGAKYDLQNVAALVLVVLYLGLGWFLAHHVFITRYEIATEKNVGEGLRIVGLADAHLSVTLDGEAFAKQVERIKALEPDAVVIAGDFVDDDSKKEDMLRACQALGTLNDTCGVFFVYGNHDNGYYNYRNFTAYELRKALTDYGVLVLEDEIVLTDERLVVIGRRDRSTRDRAEAQALTGALDKSKYILMLDHQPNDFENEALSDADLVFSGHTHGGHIFPAGLVGLIFGANDRVYGTEVRNGTTFVVTSGISGWAIPFKTGARSEIVVIDIAAA